MGGSNHRTVLAASPSPVLLGISVHSPHCCDKSVVIHRATPNPKEPNLELDYFNVTEKSSKNSLTILSL